MGSSAFQVRLTDSALNDLNEIDDYWSLRGEPERGEQYVRNLIETAETELSSPVRAQSGRLVRVAMLPETRELLVFKGSFTDTGLKTTAFMPAFAAAPRLAHAVPYAEELHPAMIQARGWHDDRRRSGSRLLQRNQRS